MLTTFVLKSTSVQISQALPGNVFTLGAESIPCSSVKGGEKCTPVEKQFLIVILVVLLFCQRLVAV